MLPSRHKYSLPGCMDCFTLKKPQALINNCMLLFPHHSLWQYNTLPTKTRKAKNLHGRPKIHQMQNVTWLKAYPPVVNLLPPLQFLCLLLFEQQDFAQLIYKKRDVACNHSKSQPLLVLSGQTQQQPLLTPATLLMQCQCYNVLAKGASGNIAELFCSLLPCLGGFLGQRKGAGEREKPIKIYQQIKEKHSTANLFLKRVVCYSKVCLYNCTTVENYINCNDLILLTAIQRKTPSPFETIKGRREMSQEICQSELWPLAWQKQKQKDKRTNWTKMWCLHVSDLQGEGWLCPWPCSPRGSACLSW